MALSFTAHYADDFGEEDIFFYLSDDGRQLKTKIRNTEFIGNSFTYLKPVTSPDKNIDVQFHLCNGMLHKFTLKCEIPVEAVEQNQIRIGILKGAVQVVDQNEGIDDYLKLSLNMDNYYVESVGDDAGFEWELEDIQKQLPAGSYLRCCFNCRYSIYSPYSNSGMMGELVCGIHSSSPHNETTQQIVYVQEFYLCPEFEFRRKVES